MSTEYRKTQHTVALHLLLITLSLIFAFPLLWMLSTALKVTDQTMRIPIVWVPNPPQWHNFGDAFTYNSDKLGYIPFLVYGRNTLMLAILTVSGTVISNALIAYGFARLRWQIGRAHV